MPSPKATSLLFNPAKCLINALDVFEQLQDIDFDAAINTVDARGVADRYVSHQATKQKQSVTATMHWFNSSTSLEAVQLDISIFTMGGTSYLAQMKSGDLAITNAGPETSGIAEYGEYPQSTSTSVELTTGLMVITEAIWTANAMTDTVSQLAVVVAGTFAGEAFSFPGILSGSKHSVKRGEAQMENVKIQLQGIAGSPTTSGDTTSLLYLAMVGSALSTMDMDTGVNEYKNGSGQTFMISRYGLKFEDKAAIMQDITLEVQGLMTVIPA